MMNLLRVTDQMPNNTAAKNMAERRIVFYLIIVTFLSNIWLGTTQELKEEIPWPALYN